MLAAILATLLAVGAAPPAPGGARSCASIATLGPVDAPIVVRWYVDPLTPGMLDLWLELRRLVGDLEGEIAIAPILVAKVTQRDPAERRTRAWFAAAACQGRAEAALRLLAREGSARLGRRLAEPESRTELAGLAGVDRRALDDPTYEALIEAGSADLQARVKAAPGRASRPPAFAIGDSAPFEDGANLEALRREIESARRRRPEPARDAARHARRGVSERLMRPPADVGMMVGGVALPHRLVILAEQVDHPDFLALGPALELRSQTPGILAIQIIARGQGRAALRLRLRLCGARHLGRELDYIRHLARDPRGETAEGALDDALDAAAEAHGCAPEEEELAPASAEGLTLPSGAWLDGAVIGQRELAALGREILRIEGTASPLDPVFSAAAPPEP